MDSGTKEETMPIPTRFPKSVRDELQELSERSGLTVSWIIRKAVEEYLDRQAVVS